MEAQQSIFDEEQLGNNGTDAAPTLQSGDGREEMDEKNHQVAHFRFLATKRKIAEFRAI